MLIETEPCLECDFSPGYCCCDIDICQMSRGESRPTSEDEYETKRLRKYKKMEFNSAKNNEKKVRTYKGRDMMKDYL